MSQNKKRRQRKRVVAPLQPWYRKHLGGLLIIGGLVLVAVIVSIFTVEALVGMSPAKTMSAVPLKSQGAGIRESKSAQPIKEMKMTGDLNARYVEKNENGIVVHRGLYPEKEEWLWQTLLQSTVYSIVNGQTPHPAVNERLKTLLTSVRDKHGKPFSVLPVHQYDLQSTAVMCESGLLGGSPCVYILLPAELNVYQMYEKSNLSDWKTTYLNEFMVGFIHEFYHLLFDDLHEMGTGRIPNQEIIKAESRAWALTCDEIMSILIATKQPLGVSNQIYYDAWQKSGRNQSDKGWQSFIASGTPDFLMGGSDGTSRIGER